jgi:hypothetical protein
MTRILSTFSCLALVLLTAHPTAAQDKPPVPASSPAAVSTPVPVSSPVVGERYHLEVSAGLWYPAPASIFVASDQWGIIGTKIDGISDLGFVKTRFGDLRIVVRPATRHKFHIDYAPVQYQAEAVLSRDVTFNGVTYHVGIPVISSLSWNSWNFGYEFDFLSRDRWFAGVIGQVRWTKADVSLSSPIVAEQAQAEAPVPGIGGIARVYATRKLAITGQLVGFKLPESVDPQRRFEGHLITWDVRGTFNFTENVGAEVGYRSFDVNGHINPYTGSLRLGGLYFAAVGRF